MILAKRAFPIHLILKKSSLTFLLLLLATGLFAQTTPQDNVRSQGARDTFIIGTGIDSTLLFLSTSDEQKLGISNSIQHIDTVLDNLHNYYQVGVLGNMGLPSYSLLAENRSESGFFRWMNLNNYNDLFTNQQPVYFYPAGKVYTKVFASIGQKQEQVFKILHSQNIKRVNLSLQFSRYSCLGFYLNQKSITDNLLFSSHAKTKSGRLGYNFYFLFNKLKYQLNGGIDSNKVSFADNILVEKQLFPVNLSATKHNIRTSEMNLLTFVRLKKNESAWNLTLNYEVNYEGNYWMNVEGLADTTDYTSTSFFSTSGTQTDSISFKRFSNSFYYRVNDRNFINAYLGYKNEFDHYTQFYIDTMVMNHIVMGGFSRINDEGWGYLRGQHVVSGFNAGNYSYDFSGGIKRKKFYLAAEANFSKQMPAYMNVVYDSPHFFWSDTLKNTEIQGGKIEIGSDKYRFKLGAVFQDTKNMIYYDTLALPKQYDSSASITRFYLQKDLKLWHIHFNNTLNYQVTNADIIRLPQFYTSHQLYYEGKLFKKALWLQVGFQARYISAFKANAYMPATNQFYLQNEKEYGNYVFVDLFMNAQIDRFRFFIMASHINQGLSGGNYMLCPNYAMPDRSIKAGLTWMFFD